jgi:predicted ribosomally synthesized peptide with SipW-like signal peptide
MKKKLLMNVLVLVLAVAMIAAGTMAWFIDSDDAGEATFTAGTVSIEAGRKVVSEEGELVNPDTVYSTFYPIRVVEYSPGLRKDGQLVKPPRNIPENALKFETGQSESNFCSLGIGGSIILEFDHALYLPELAIVAEDTWGSQYPLEEAYVYVSDTGIEDDDWILVGIADNTTLQNNQTISKFDLSQYDITYVKYVKVVDCTDLAAFDDYTGNSNTVDGFDLNAVSIKGYTQEEDNWNPGDKNERVYKITNTGTKAINLRGEFTGKWYEYNEETGVWDESTLSADVVTYELLSGETDWEKIGDYFYYIGSILGTYTDETISERTKELRINVCLDGPGTENEYQGKRFIVTAIFEAIQASNGAAQASGWAELSD